MKKYWIIFKNRLQSSFAYRFNTLTYFLAEVLVLVVLSYLWLSIYHQGNRIGTYSLSGLIIYYILTKFINLTIKAQDIGRVVGDIIREGELNNYLLKPLNFTKYVMSLNLGFLAFNLIIYMLVYSIILIGISLWLPDAIHLSGVSVLYFFISFIIAFFINFYFFYIIGTLTFYLGFVMGFNYIMMSITNFLSGNLIPIDLFPKQLLAISNFLPFKYITYVPIAIITGKIDLNNPWPLFAEGAAWVIALFMISKILYKRGLKKYEAYSG